MCSSDLVQLAGANRDWGYRRIQGALSNLGHEIARSTIAEILLAIPTKPNSNPKARRTGFRREAEQQSERSDAGVLIVG